MVRWWARRGRLVAALVAILGLRPDFDITTTVSSFDAPFPGASRLVHTGGNTPTTEILRSPGGRAAGHRREHQRRGRANPGVPAGNRDLVACWVSRSYLATIAKPQVKGLDRYLSRDMFYASVWLDR